MKRLIALLCTAASILFASAAIAMPNDMTTTQFLAACAQDASWCQMQVSIDSASAAWNTENSHVCAAGVDAAAMTGPILDWMRAHPEKADANAASTMRDAMQALWPCA